MNKVLSCRNRRSPARIALAVAFGLLVAALPLGTARAWDQTAYAALMNHQGRPNMNGLKCRAETWAGMLEWLYDDVALAHVAQDSVSYQITKVESEIESLEMKYENAGFRHTFNGDLDVSHSGLTSLRGDLAQLDKALGAIEDRRQQDLNDIAALLALPPCTNPVTPPPPPPPRPPYPPGPNPPANAPAFREPHHVVTSCAKCKSLADQVNEIIDELKDAQAQRRPEGIINKLQGDMDTYARALNVCERSCLVQPPQDRMGVPPVPPPLPRNDKRASHALREDSPYYMENYRSTKKSSGHATTGSEHAGTPPDLEERRDHPDNGKTDVPVVPKPDLPSTPPHS